MTIPSRKCSTPPPLPSPPLSNYHVRLPNYCNNGVLPLPLETLFSLDTAIIRIALGRAPSCCCFCRLEHLSIIVRASWRLRRQLNVISSKSNTKAECGGTRPGNPLAPYADAAGIVTCVWSTLLCRERYRPRSLRRVVVFFSRCIELYAEDGRRSKMGGGGAAPKRVGWTEFGGQGGIYSLGFVGG